MCFFIFEQQQFFNGELKKKEVKNNSFVKKIGTKKYYKEVVSFHILYDNHSASIAHTRKKN